MLSNCFTHFGGDTVCNLLVCFVEAVASKISSKEGENRAFSVVIKFFITVPINMIYSQTVCKRDDD